MIYWRTENSNVLHGYSVATGETYSINKDLTYDVVDSCGTKSVSYYASGEVESIDLAYSAPPIITVSEDGKFVTMNPVGTELKYTYSVLDNVLPIEVPLPLVR